MDSRTDRVPELQRSFANQNGYCQKIVILRWTEKFKSKITIKSINTLTYKNMFKI